MDISWIKITTNIFDDEKVMLIESLPEGDTILVIWFKLLTLAGKSNNNGIFMIADKIPYTDEMLATIFRRSLNTVRLALQTFQQFGMIEIIDGVVTLPNWDKYQNIESLDKVREQTRNRVANYRAKQKALIEETTKKDENVTLCNVTVTEQNKKENKNKKYIYISDNSERLANYLLSECKKMNPNFSRTENQMKEWSNDIGKLNGIDKYSWEDIEVVLKWAKQDSFWNSNIQSGSKFREKFETLYPKCKKNNVGIQKRGGAYDVACNHIDSQHDYSKDAGAVLENGELGF